MSERRFFVRFHVATLASIASREAQLQYGDRPVWRFSWANPDSKLVLHDVVTAKGGTLVHEGLALELDVPANELDEAISRARNLAEGLVNLISYATSTGCNPASLNAAYEIKRMPATVDVVWVLQEMPPPPLGDLRPIDSPVLRRVFSLYDKADQDRIWCISQAAQWLRKAALELETVGQFVALWEGLEAISWTLPSSLQSNEKEIFPTCPQCSHVIKQCPECGRALGRRNDMAAIRSLFEQHTQSGAAAYRGIRRHRGQLMHGGKKLTSEFLNALREDLEALRQGLSLGIGLSIGLDIEAAQRIAATTPRRATRPMTVKVRGKLPEFTAPSLDKPHLQPYVEWEPDRVYSTTADGKLNVAFKQTLTMRNAAFQAESYEMWGDEHAKAKGEAVP